MAVFWEQVQKAKSRLQDFDLAGRLAEMRGHTPGELNSAEQLAARENFLRRSLCNPAEATIYHERVLDGNELQPVNYLPRGALAARAIARIEIRTPAERLYGWGTGFLIAPNVLLTNNHVLPTAASASPSRAQFRYERDLDDRLGEAVVFRFRPEQLFYTSKELDFTVVAVEPEPVEGDRPLEEFGFLPLLDVPGKVSEGEWLTIIQHPAGEHKQLCARENRLMKRTDDVLWYSTDTLGGSSGSPVFNNDWYVVALHHSGIPEERDGKVRAVDGNFYDRAILSEDRIKWLANEGIRASRIAQTLKAALPDHPLLLPMYRATPETARVGTGYTMTYERSKSLTTIPKETHMNGSTKNVTVPVEFTIRVGTNGDAPVVTAINGRSMEQATAQPAPLARERLAVLEEQRKRKPREAAFDAPFDSDYSKRKGYDAQFLGKDFAIHLPTLSPSLQQAAAKLIGDDSKFVLKYHNFSVAMHEERRFAIYSAANVHFGQRYEMKRPSVVWRQDPRITQKAQVTNFFYHENQFDRGHLTRREDLEFGLTPVDALQSAADTCHWTNCVPQHEQFNQNEETWHGIELHLLERAILEGQMKAQVITGPIFDGGDPEYKKIVYPLSYWKIIAAINEEKRLVATAYIASQAEVIEEFGIEAAPADPFGPFKTFQVPISEVERLTQLTFTYGTPAKPLSDVDALQGQTAAALRRRRRNRLFESAGVVTPERYVELASVDDIVM